MTFALSQPLLLWATPAFDPENNADFWPVHPKEISTQTAMPNICDRSSSAQAAYLCSLDFETSSPEGKQPT